jgi:GxxExxY protein
MITQFLQTRLGSDLMPREPLIEEKLTGSVIGAFFEVYNTLGFGFLEGIYAAALELELVGRLHRVQREAAVPVIYKGVTLATHRVDMLIDEVLIVEIKSTAVLPPNSKRQLLNYMRAARLSVGLLLHFGPEPKVHRQVLSRNSNQA